MNKDYLINLTPDVGSVTKKDLSRLGQIFSNIDYRIQNIKTYSYCRNEFDSKSHFIGWATSEVGWDKKMHRVDTGILIRILLDLIIKFIPRRLVALCLVS